MTAERYRKKPVVVEAMRLARPYRAVQKWCDGVLVKSGMARDNSIVGMYIDTLEGRMYAEAGDWIIKGVKGEFYPCKPDIFEATYEPADTEERGGA